MRDGSLMQMHEANAKRNALLLGQFEFLETRQRAHDRVLAVSRLWDRIVWLFAPKKYLLLVDAVQENLLRQGQEALEAARKKPKVNIVKPGLVS